MKIVSTMAMAIAALVSAPASAAIQTFNFGGFLVTGPSQDPTGERVSGSFSYDDAATPESVVTDGNGHDVLRSYNAFTAFSLSGPTFNVFSTASTQFGRLTVADDYHGVTDGIDIGVSEGFGGTVPDGYVFSGINLGLQVGDPAFWSSAELPTLAQLAALVGQNPSIVQNRYVTIDFASATGGNPLSFTALIDRAGNVAPVPEPATWAMLVAGFGFAGSAARRRRALHQATV